ncbi:MAG: cation transporter [Bacteroidales bacterium]|nr:cation transporter [Bacteroidales bacterium]
MAHNHVHNNEVHQGKKLLITIFLNLLITFSQVIGGIISGSLSLLSDALHNFSDVIALVISFIATRLKRRKESVKKTFGYKRAEIMAAFINSSTLILIGVYLIYEAVQRFYLPVSIESGWVIVLSATSIVFNGISALLLIRDSHQNMNIKSAYIHLLTDMLTSIAVLIGGILMYYFNIYWIDGLLTLIIAIYLIYMSWGILGASLKVLMQFTPSGIIIEDISNKIINIPSVKNIHHVHIWQLNDKQIHFEAHVEFVQDDKLSETNKILEEIRILLLEEFGIDHVTLQPEIEQCDGKELIYQEH